MSKTGSHSHLITQNLHSMCSILYLKYKEDSLYVYWISTQSIKVGVVSGYAHVITFGID